MIAQALTIAGSDPSGGAGVQMDLKVFQAFEIWGWSAITALTVQTPSGVRGWEAVAPALVASQVQASTGGGRIAAAKTGMLPTPECVQTVAAALAPAVALVVDPVLVATAGQALTSGPTVDAMRTHLLPRALLVTPNADEATALTGIEVRDRASQRDAGRALCDVGVFAALVTGGHLPGKEVVDVLVDRGGAVEEFVGRRDAGGEIRGTGCALSAAVTALIARDPSGGMAAAVGEARRFVAAAIGRALRIGDGARVMSLGARDGAAGLGAELGASGERARG